MTDVFSVGSSSSTLGFSDSTNLGFYYLTNVDSFHSPSGTVKSIYANKRLRPRMLWPTVKYVIKKLPGICPLTMCLFELFDCNGVQSFVIHKLVFGMHTHLGETAD